MTSATPFDAGSPAREAGAPVDDRPHNTGAIVLVAAHDEAARIGATLAALRVALPGAKVWVADDGSRDGTAHIAQAAGARVVRGERRVGKGGAMTRAALAVLGADADRGVADGDSGADADRGVADGDSASRGAAAGVVAVAGGVAAGAAGAGAAGAGAAGTGDSEDDPSVVLMCDGDLGESAAQLAVLVRAVRDGGSDLAIAGFAHRAGGGFGLALGFARWAIRRRCGLATGAPLSGQRVVRADLLAQLLPFAGGYGMEVGMTIDAVRAGARVEEIELDLTHRASGRTLAGFAHRGRQLLDCARAYATRSAPRRPDQERDRAARR